MTITDETAEYFYDDLELQPAVARSRDKRRAHARSRRPLDRLVVGLLATVLVLTTAVGVLLVRAPARNGSARIRTTEQSKAIAPAPTPSTAPPVFNAQGLVVPPGTPGAVSAGAGPPPTITVDGTSAPNPLMQANLPGVTYAGANYFGAPQAGVGPEGPVAAYGGLIGCPMYVGRMQIGWQFPGKVNVGGTVMTYQCNASDTPASIPSHP